MTAHDGGPPSIDPATKWSEIPTAILKAELARRQDSSERPACGSSGTRAAYNTPLHVAALFLILILSVLACSFPIIVRRFPRLPVPHHFLFLSRHFGTGVLIATAFVHLFPTAYISLTDPCLPPFWNKGYPAMPGLIAMMSVLTVVGIEMFFATRGAGHVHGSGFDTLGVEGAAGHDGGASRRANASGRPHHRRSAGSRRFGKSRAKADGRPGDIALGSMPGGSTERLVPDDSASVVEPPLHTHTKSTPGEESPSDDSDIDLSSDELNPPPPSPPQPPTAASSGLLPNGHRTRKARQHRSAPRTPRASLSSSSSSGSLPAPATAPTTPQQQKLLLQCLLLEAGILFHSVFIGMALSVSVGPPFVVLLVAIAFHQTFEGLALGSRIAALAFPARSWRPWAMALAYGATTPAGQALGLAVHRLYDPASRTGLLTVGVMNAVSSGLLLFAGLVELLAEDFLSDQSYVALRGRRRVEACAAVVAGAGLMAFVGAWA